MKRDMLPEAKISEKGIEIEGLKLKTKLPKRVYLSLFLDPNGSLRLTLSLNGCLGKRKCNFKEKEGKIFIPIPPDNISRSFVGATATLTPSDVPETFSARFSRPRQR